MPKLSKLRLHTFILRIPTHMCQMWRNHPFSSCAKSPDLTSKMQSLSRGTLSQLQGMHNRKFSGNTTTSPQARKLNNHHHPISTPILNINNKKTLLLLTHIYNSILIVILPYSIEIRILFKKSLHSCLP